MSSSIQPSPSDTKSQQFIIEHNKKQQNESFLLKATIAGSVCAFVSALLNGIDVTKIRMQNQSSSNAKYHGLLSGISLIYKEEGLNGLTKGIFPSMLRELSYSSIRMGCYEPIRQLLTKSNGRPSDTNPLMKYLAALITGGVGSAICNPFDLAKTAFQASTTTVMGNTKGVTTFEFLNSVYVQHGISGLYKGWPATSIRASVLTSAQLGSYDTIKNNILINRFQFKEGFILHLIVSFTAGIITTTAANPCQYTGLSDCIIQLYRQEGMMGFFKGWVPAYWRLGPHTVLSLLMIEKVRNLCGLDGI